MNSNEETMIMNPDIHTEVFQDDVPTELLKLPDMEFTELFSNQPGAFQKDVGSEEATPIKPRKEIKLKYMEHIVNEEDCYK